MGASASTQRRQPVERSRRILGASMRESQFQALVIDAARALRWRVAHFRPALTRDGRVITPVAADGAGFPDLVLVHPDGHVLFRELKTDRGRVAAHQQAWGEALVEAGADWAVWRPRDWPLVLEQLRRGAAS